MRHSPADSIETRYGWWVVAASTLMMSVGYGGSYLVVVGLKPIAAEFGWPRSVPSLAHTLAWIGAGFGGVLMGYWSDRRGMLGPARLGACMVGAGCILSGYSTGAFLLLSAHGLFLGVLGTGTMFSPLLTNATRWFDRRRGMAVAIVAGGQGLAGAIWPPIFRWGMDEHGWRSTMIAYGILAICLMLPLSFVFRRRPPFVLIPHQGAQGGQGGAADKLGLPSGLVQGMLGLAVVGCCVAMAMPMVHIVAYCSDLGYASARGAEMLSLLLACGLVSRLGFGWLADRIGALKTILLSSSMQAVALALFISMESLLGLYLVAALFGLVFGGIVPSYALAVRELFAEREAGWRIGVVYLFATSGMGLGGYLGGVIFDLTGGYAVAFATGVAFNLVNLFLLIVLVWRQRGMPWDTAALPA